MFEWTDAAGEEMEDSEAEWELIQEVGLPECSICGQTITEDRAFNLDGEWICDDCVSDHRIEVPVDWVRVYETKRRRAL